MKLSIIIPTLNEAQNIQKAVQSAWNAGANEVIVVDGGSVDRTRKIANVNNATVVTSAPGRGIQQNHAAKIAVGDVLLFLHADCVLVPSAGQQIETAFQQSSCLGGAFRQTILAKGWIYRAIEKGNAQRVRWFKMPYGDQGLFFRRETFEQLGGFPEVRLMEDLLLMRKFRKLASPMLLKGPLYVGARRWQQQGPIRQTLRNWGIVVAERLGISPNRLSKFYPVNQEKTPTHIRLSQVKYPVAVIEQQEAEPLHSAETLN